MKRIFLLIPLTLIAFALSCSKGSDTPTPTPLPTPTPPAPTFTYTLSNSGRELVKFTSTSTTVVNFTTDSQLKKVESIADEAFKDNTTITKIILPNTVESIGQGAFKGCTSLSHITLPENAAFKKINVRTFEECRSLQKISIPNSVAEIDMYAFADAALSEVKLPDNLIYIKEQAFAGNKNLKEITIPKSVGQIGTGAFIDTELATVKVLATYPPRLNIVNTAQGSVGPFPIKTLKEITVPKIATDDYRYEDAFWSLYGYYINRNVPFKPLVIDKTTFTIKVGEQEAASISGSNKYGLKRDKATEEIAYIAITPDNKILGVRGLKAGSFKATLYDRISREEKILTITITP